MHAPWLQQYISVLPFPNDTTISQRITFLHTTLGSPVLSTLRQVLNVGYLTFMLEITVALVQKHPLLSITMIKGHLDQVCMNQRSTRTVQVPPTTAEYPAAHRNDTHPTTVSLRRTDTQPLRQLLFRNGPVLPQPDEKIPHQEHHRQHRHYHTV